jgi:hypothetical protein
MDFILRVLNKTQRKSETACPEVAKKFEILEKIVKLFSKIVEEVNLVKNEKYETSDQQILHVNFYDFLM